MLALPSRALAQGDPALAPAPANPNVELAAPRPLRVVSPEASEEEASTPAEPGYVRHGFTMELGLGISQTSVASDVGARDHAAFGLAPLSLGMGAFLSPKLALIGRAAGTSTFRDDSHNKSYQTVNAFYGPTLQYWVTDRFYFGGGAGLTVLAADPFGAKSAHQFTETGFGVNTRVGFAFALPGDHHALLLGFDAFGSRFEQSSTLAVALNLGWQFF